jgi:hypothetical protein
MIPTTHPNGQPVHICTRVACGNLVRVAGTRCETCEQARLMDAAHPYTAGCPCERCEDAFDREMETLSRRATRLHALRLDCAARPARVWLHAAACVTGQDDPGFPREIVGSIRLHPSGTCLEVWDAPQPPMPTEAQWGDRYQARLARWEQAVAVTGLLLPLASVARVEFLRDEWEGGEE